MWQGINWVCDWNMDNIEDLDTSWSPNMDKHGLIGLYVILSVISPMSFQGESFGSVKPISWGIVQGNWLVITFCVKFQVLSWCSWNSYLIKISLFLASRLQSLLQQLIFMFISNHESIPDSSTSGFRCSGCMDAAAENFSRIFLDNGIKNCLPPISVTMQSKHTYFHTMLKPDLLCVTPCIQRYYLPLWKPKLASMRNVNNIFTRATYFFYVGCIFQVYFPRSLCYMFNLYNEMTYDFSIVNSPGTGKALTYIFTIAFL